MPGSRSAASVLDLEQPQPVFGSIDARTEHSLAGFQGIEQEGPGVELLGKGLDVEEHRPGLRVARQIDQALQELGSWAVRWAGSSARIEPMIDRRSARLSCCFWWSRCMETLGNARRNQTR